MDLTAAQRRLIESDDSLRQAERQMTSEPGEPSHTLAYAVEYLRNNPELAQQAGINAFTPEDIQVLRESFNTLMDMLRWIDNRTDTYLFWEGGSHGGQTFWDAFPKEGGTPGEEPWENGGWARVDEIFNNVRRILNKDTSTGHQHSIYSDATRI